MSSTSPSEREHLIHEMRRYQAEMQSTKMRSGAPFMELDLTVPQVKVVWLLGQSAFTTMGTLAQKLGITVSACSHLVDKLVRAGFVLRSEDPDDRRVVRCSLSDSGRGLIDQFRQSMPFERDEFWDRLSIDELRVVVQAMAILHRVMSGLADADAKSSGGSSR